MMKQCVEKMAGYFDKAIKTQKNEMNIKEVVTGFTIDVIATTSFATETNSNGSTRKNNAFLDNAISLLGFAPLRMFSFAVMPKWFKRLTGTELGLKMDSFNFFADLSKAIVNQRQSQSGKRNDLVQLMMDAFVYDNDLQNTDYSKLTATADNGKIYI